MVDIEYANAYREVLEILKYISVDDYNKISKESFTYTRKAFFFGCAQHGQQLEGESPLQCLIVANC
jgi:hypothetical protein